MGETRMKLDIIYNKDCRKMDEVDDNSVHLLCTSCPYNVGVIYDENHPDNMPLNEYLDFSRAWLTEAFKKLMPGGRAAINIADTGRKPYLPLHKYILDIVLDEMHMLLLGITIWNKGRAVGATKTSWGTWRDAKSVQQRDIHEFILLFVKPGHEHNSKGVEDPYILPCQGFEKSKFLTGHDFALDTFSIWDFSPETNREMRKLHKALYPVTLPKRVIEFLTRPNQIVLDPFMGLGTTAVGCKVLPEKRHFIGYEINQNYVNYAINRISRYNFYKLESFTKPTGLKQWMR